MNPKISVIIPVYNSEEYLPRAINSILKSSMVNEIEIIVIDDCSLGNCKEIIQKYPNIKYIKHRTNLGLFHARYTGIINASGEFIAHLDPDDWIENDIYSKAYNTAINNNSDVVLFNVIQCNEDGKEWIENHNIMPTLLNKSGNEFLKKIYFFSSHQWIWHVCWNKLIKSEIAKNLIKDISSFQHTIMYEDLLWSTILFFNLRNQNSISIIEEVGLKYFRHSNAITGKNDFNSLKKKIGDIIFVLQKIEDIFINSDIYEEYNKLFLQTKHYIVSIYLKNDLKFYEKELPQFQSIYNFFRTYDSKEQYNLLLEKIAEEFITKIVSKNLKEVTIFGTNDFSNLLFNNLIKNKIIVKSFTLSNPNENYFNNLPIYTVQKSLENGTRNFIISSFSSFHLIKKTIIELNKKELSLEIIGYFEN